LLTNYHRLQAYPRQCAGFDPILFGTTSTPVEARATDPARG